MKEKELEKIFKKGLTMHHITNTAYPLTPRSFVNYKITGEEKIKDLLKVNFAKEKELSIYVHIPFCQSRCRFCEYAVVSGEEKEKTDKYVEYLLKEMSMYKKLLKDKKIVGLDVGGGTPTKLSINQLKVITDYLQNNFNILPTVEMSIETTPIIAANEIDKIKSLYDMGYKRISMGIQTINPILLESFKREGNVNIYKKAVDNIRKAGFEKLNIDLMYGFLNQSKEDFTNTLEYAVKINPEYITLYRNRYKGTKIAYEAEDVTLNKVNEQYEIAYNILTKNGYSANYGKNTFSKIKNDYGTSDYLTKRVINGTSYIGFGLGAQSFGYSYLSYNEGAASKSLKSYFQKIDNNHLPLQDIYDLPKEEAIAKMVSVAFYFGFLDFKEFKKRFNLEFTDYFAEELEFLLKKKLIIIKSNKMIITKKGTENIGGIIPLFYSLQSKEELFKLKKIF